MRMLIFVLVISLSILSAGIASAGSGAGAIVYSFNNSARFEGMGSAGVGAPWGGATNQWANPAQLAYRQGFHFEWARSQLAAGLADDIVYSDNELMFGYSGITLTWGLWPAHGKYLDMGTQWATDENGQQLGPFSSYMKSSSYGLAVDVVQVFDLIKSRTGSEGWYRYASLSFGYVRKNYEDQLGGNIQDTQGGGTATAKTFDLGWVARVTPLNTLDTDGALGFLLGAAYGASTLNGGDEFIMHSDADQSDLLPRAYLSGWSFHGEMALGKENWHSSMGGFLAGLHGTFNPLLSFTYADQVNQPGYYWDNDREEYFYGKDPSGAQDETGEGWEVGLANIAFLRRGHFTALYGDIDDDTWGWGINLQENDKWGVRYDSASVPQAKGLPNVTRRTWSLWVDPMAIMAASD
jgi:hypothetical protein